jgi:glycosyltransferase involved in cell wall biosynthesis
MLRGCPVIATDIGVLREVGGDAAWYTDTTDPRVFGADITRLLADDGARQRLSEIGTARSTLFTWDRSAEQTAATIQRTLDQVATSR